MKTVRFAWLPIIVLGLAWGSFARAESDALSASDIVRKVRETFGRLEDYKVRVHVHVDVEGFEVPDRIVTLYYKRPDRVHLDGADFAMLPKEGLMADPSQLFDEDRYDIRLAGVESAGDRKAYRLNLFASGWEPIDDQTDAPDLTAWVDAEHWVVFRMEAQSSGKKQGVVTIEHGLVAGSYWLPKRTRVEIFMDALPPGASGIPPRDSSAVSRQPDRGTIELTFDGYEVNVGLPDSLFVQPWAKTK